MRIALLAAPLAFLGAAACAETAANPQIDYTGFVELTASLQQVREANRLERDEFLRRAAADGALLLDARSESAFAAGHIDGAVNLPFSDFNSKSLREVVGDDPDRPIYIYCNNNFSDNAAPVIAKMAPLALNIPTFINLHGYGYTNVWELAGVMPLSEVPWTSGLAPPDKSE
jgi:phage shock protein E